MAKETPFENALAWAKGRGIVLPDIYYNELQGLARAMAFTVTGVSSVNQLQAVLDSLTHSLEAGDTFKKWKKKVAEGEILLDLPPHQIETVWRNALQNMYNRGRCEQQKRNAETRPYGMYDATNDGRTRPRHAAMSNFVALLSDEVWLTWTPQCGHNCRCKRIALTEKQAQRFKAADQRRLDEDPDFAADRLDALTTGPDPGWDFSPCADPTEGVNRSVDNARAKSDPSFVPELDKLKVANPLPVGPGFGEPGGPPLWGGQIRTAEEAIARGKARRRAMSKKMEEALAMHRLADELVTGARETIEANYVRIDDLWDEYAKRGTDEVRRDRIRAEIARLMEANSQAHKDIDRILGDARADMIAACKELRRSMRARWRDHYKELDLEPPKVQAADRFDHGMFIGEFSRREAQWLRRQYIAYSEHFGVENVRFWQLKHGERAWARPSSGQLEVGSHAKHKNAVVVWHELGHYAEDRYSGVGISNEWIAGRAEGEMERLSVLTGNQGYRPDEVAYPDKFLDPYVGKVYSDFQGTEVVSMGTQQFADDELLTDFLLNHLEHADLILGMMKL